MQPFLLLQQNLQILTLNFKIFWRQCVRPSADPAQPHPLWSP